MDQNVNGLPENEDDEINDLNLEVDNDFSFEKEEGALFEVEDDDDEDVELTDEEVFGNEEDE